MQGLMLSASHPRAYHTCGLRVVRGVPVGTGVPLVLRRHSGPGPRGTPCDLIPQPAASGFGSVIRWDAGESPQPRGTGMDGFRVTAVRSPHNNGGSVSDDTLPPDRTHLQAPATWDARPPYVAARRPRSPCGPACRRGARRVSRAARSWSLDATAQDGVVSQHGRRLCARCPRA